MGVFKPLRGGERGQARQPAVTQAAGRLARARFGSVRRPGCGFWRLPTWSASHMQSYPASRGEPCRREVGVKSIQPQPAVVENTCCDPQHFDIVAFH